MDSKAKMDVGIPQAQMEPIRLDDGRLRRTNRWLVGAVVVLALAGVALGMVLIVQVNSEESPTTTTPSVALADRPSVALVDDFLAAHNTNDPSTVADQYVADATLQVRTDPLIEGKAAIETFYRQLFATFPDLVVKRTGPVVRSGDLVTFPVQDSNGTAMTWVLVWSDSKITQHAVAW